MLMVSNFQIVQNFTKRLQHRNTIVNIYKNTEKIIEFIPAHVLPLITQRSSFLAGKSSGRITN